MHLYPLTLFIFPENLGAYLQLIFMSFQTAILNLIFNLIHLLLYTCSKIRIVIMTTVVYYWVGDDEHITYIDSKFTGGVG